MSRTDVRLAYDVAELAVLRGRERVLLLLPPQVCVAEFPSRRSGGQRRHIGRIVCDVLVRGRLGAGEGAWGRRAAERGRACLGSGVAEIAIEVREDGARVGHVF